MYNKHGSYIPEQKRCSKCKQYKKVYPEFRIRYRKLKSGVVGAYPRPACRECEQKDRVRRARRKDRREGYVHPEPLAEWLKARYPRGEGIKQLANMAKVDESQIRRIMNGWYVSNGNRYKLKRVRIDHVDKILIAHGHSTSISTLYPETDS